MECKHIGSVANPPHGERGNFRKLTITFPPDIYQQIVVEWERRKKAGEKNATFSSIVREGLAEYVSKRDGDSSI